jgi:hypothetical protein
MAGLTAANRKVLRHPAPDEKKRDREREGDVRCENYEK